MVDYLVHPYTYKDIQDVGNMRNICALYYREKYLNCKFTQVTAANLWQKCNVHELRETYLEKIKIKNWALIKVTCLG